MTLSGIPMPMFSAPATTLLQELVEPDMQGRVFGVNMLISHSVMPVGLMIFGPLADVVAIETILAVASALLVLPGLWIYFWQGQGLPKPALVVPDCEMHPEECA
jgi:DHA3 family macrolide efflux protein-like MFS transporter